MRQDISRHTQVSIQSAIHNQRGQPGCITEYTHANAKTAGGYRPDDDDIATLPPMFQWELAEEGPPEEKPQCIGRCHRDYLYDKCYAVFHGCL
jgi:hypothetical protein